MRTLAKPAAVGCRLSAVLAVALVGLSGFAAPAWDGSTADWMGFLPKETPLCEIMMPASHNAGMIDGLCRTLPPEPQVFHGLVECQSLSIGEQLEAGSRRLDIRPWIRNGELVTCHCTYVEKLRFTSGGTGVSFREIFEETRRFLEAHDTEVVFFYINKFTYGDDAETEAKTREAVKALMEEYGDIVFTWDAKRCGDGAKCLPPRTGALTLGEVHGKVICLWSETDPQPGAGIWSLPTSGKWTNTDDAAAHVEAQREAWAEWARSCEPSEVGFLLAWHLAWQPKLRNICQTNRQLADRICLQLPAFLKEGVEANGKAMFVAMDYVTPAHGQTVIAHNFADYGEATLSVEGAGSPQVGEPLTAAASVEGCTYSWFVTDQKGHTAPLADGDTYTPTEADLEHALTVSAWKNGVLVAAKTVWLSKLPVVYLTTDDGKAITSKEEYVPAHLTIQGNAEFDLQYDGATEVKGRGNSSWTLFPQKPYKLKLDKKTDLFGFGKNKHWVLLSNWRDDVMLRNWCASNLAKELGIVGMDMTWVTVVLNGSYNGVYMLAEHIRVDKNRVNIADWESEAEQIADELCDALKNAKVWSKDEANANKKRLEAQMSENFSWLTSGVVSFDGNDYRLADYDLGGEFDFSGGYLYEMDMYWDELSKFKTKGGLKVCINKPEAAATDPTLFEAAKQVWQNFEDAVDDKTGCNADGQHYSALADVDSMAAFWLVNETLANVDAYARSRYAFVDRGGKLTFGPVWDFDASCGTLVTVEMGPWALPNHWTVATMPGIVVAPRQNFFRSWVKHRDFCERAQTMYWETVRPWMTAFLADKGDADVALEYLREARQAYDDRFVGPGDLLPDGKVFRSFLKKRLVWLDKQFKDVDTLMRSVRKN